MAINKKKARTAKSDSQINKVLVDNFVALQKVITNLAIKFDGLSENISKLLQLFEISAKSFAEKQRGMPSPELLERKMSIQNREFVEKIDKLLEQNKIIAKGMTLLEERISEKEKKEAREAMRPKPMPDYEDDSDFHQRLPRI